MSCHSRNLLAGIFAVMLFATSCASHKTQTTPDTASLGEAAAFSKTPARGRKSQRAIIWTAWIKVTVADPAEALEHLISDVEALDGIVEESMSRRSNSTTARIRVPAASLDDLLDRVAGLGHEEQRTVSSQDVTEQIADLYATLNNNRALRDRLRSLLERATSVEEVLKVERELTRIQTEIDQQEGRLERLQTQVSMSTIDVELERKKILGPLGYLFNGTIWTIGKLFVIRN